MLRVFGVILTLALISGCAHRPLQVAMTGDVTAQMPPSNTASRLVTWTLSGSPECAAKVAIIDVDGLLVNKNLRGLGSLGENPVALFREKLDAVAADPDIHAVVLRINSPGGGVTATDIMRRDLEALRACRGIPIIACLMDVGTGGAYYLATAADSIVAHPTSITGGMGVLLNLYNLEDALGQFNVVPIPIKAGEKIDLASPIRPMEADEREILERIAREFHERFRVDVNRARPQHLATDEDFDGRVLTAGEALDKRLIDGTGYVDDAIAAARQSAGLPPCAPVVMFRRCNDRAFTAYDVTPNVPLQNSLIPINVPGLDRSSLPTFLYLWQPDPSYVTAAGAG
jgi:protease-4